MHGRYSGDYYYDPESYLMTQFFKCSDWSDVKIYYKFLGCNADYNDFIRLKYNDITKDFVRCS